jgi:hypothetical protein
MIGRVLAVATLTLRGAVRSRALFGLAVLLLFLMIGLPMTVKGSGSPASDVNVLLYYTLGCAWAVIMVATLLLSCAGISRDIEQEKIRLVAVKPVRKTEIWLGKWFGVLAMNAVLLVFVGVTVSGLLSWKIRSWDPATKKRLRQTVLVANRTIPHRPDDIGEDLERMYEIELDSIKEHGRETSAFQRKRIRGSIRHALLTAYSQVSPGNGKAWQIDIPRAAKVGEPMALHINFSPLSGEIRSERGSWSLSAGSDSELVIEDRIVAGMGNRIPLPDDFVSRGQTLSVRFENATGGSSVVFDPEAAIELRIRESSFARNLFFSLLVIFCQLALLSAFGLAAGTFFSFPVATFVATVLVFLSMTGHYFVVSEKSDVLSPVGVQPREQSVFHAVGETLVLGLERISGPALRLNSLVKLSNGLLVSLGSVFHAMLVVIGYSAVLTFISCIYLSRRELAA